MRASQVVFSFFRYRRSHAHIAFVLMGFQGWVAGRKVPSGALRLLGCGSGNGFSIVPDLTRYCLMSVLAEPNELIQLPSTRLYRWVSRASIEQLHFVLRPASGHGTWDGDALFQYSNHRVDGRPFAVLTRARIASGRATAFWRSVPELSRSVRDASGCAYHIGFGEYPILRLATLSIWRDMQSMQGFAYRHSPHHAVIKDSRLGDWMPESMFVRFEIEAIHGDVARYPKLATLATEAGIRAGDPILPAACL